MGLKIGKVFKSIARIATKPIKAKVKLLKKTIDLSKDVFKNDPVAKGVRRLAKNDPLLNAIRKTDPIGDAVIKGIERKILP